MLSIVTGRQVLKDSPALKDALWRRDVLINNGRDATVGCGLQYKHEILTLRGE